MLNHNLKLTPKLTTKMKIMTMLWMVCVTTILHAQQDIPKAKDSDLISRYPDSWIIQYSENEYDDYTFALDNLFPKGDSKKVEGKRTSIDYELPQGKSQLQLHKNYEEALKDKGFKILFSCLQGDCNPLSGSFTSVPYKLFESKTIPQLAKSGNPYRGDNASYLTAEKTVNDKTTTVTVMSGFTNYANVYRIDIIESRALDLGKITVNDIREKLDEVGKIALYGIQFEFNKSDILPGSGEVLSAIASYLNDHPGVSIFVVGHTDNVGDYQTNLELSQDRAKAVVNALANDHKIAPSRMTHKGVAMLSPVSSNDYDEGRTLNRRVEIVKQ